MHSVVYVYVQVEPVYNGHSPAVDQWPYDRERGGGVTDLLKKRDVDFCYLGFELRWL